VAKKTSPRILILGLGGMGYHLARMLQEEEYAVTAIESDREQCHYADDELDIRVVQGDAMDIDAWRQADGAAMDTVIGATDSDAVNIFAARIGDKFGIANKIARVRSLQYGRPDSLLSNRELMLDLLVHPEELVAQEIVRVIKLRGGHEIIPIAEEQVQMLAAKVTANSPLVNLTMREISSRHRTFAFRIVAIARGIETMIPYGDVKLLANDRLFIMVGATSLQEAMAMTGQRLGRQQRVLIVGGGLIGNRVAELLQKTVSVTIIEHNQLIAEKLSQELFKTEILHGDGTSSSVLHRAAIESMDTFIAATGDNETNIMSSLLAKNLMTPRSGGAEKVIAMVYKNDYQVLAATIGLDLALNPKIFAATEILKFIRRSELISVAHLHGFDAEVVELRAGAGAPITRKPLAQLDPTYRGKLLVGAVRRDGHYHVALGQTRIEPGERAIVVCHSTMLKTVRTLFGS
jgi:trk system potassium uptake protein TrkA